MTGNGSEPRLSRRQLIQAAGGVAGYAASGGIAGSIVTGGLGVGASEALARAATGAAFDGTHRFRSAPHIRPPAVYARGRAVASGYLFLGVRGGNGSQPGSLIIDDRGEPVWFRALALKGSPTTTPWTSNFRVSTYRGSPVLVWWEGLVVPPGFGQGEGVVLDTSYREVARIRAANGRSIDLHELILTPEGTALFTCLPQPVRADLTSVGGPSNGYVLESIIQEVDVRTGRLLLEWQSLKHIPMSESYRQPENPYDYLHANSIQVLPDGHLLVSARHTSAAYKIHRRTGQVLWRLGGKRSDYSIGRNAHFAWQHHVHQVSEREITVFDNGSDGVVNSERQSRGLILDVDHARKSVRLKRSYKHSPPSLALAMGSVQILPDRHVLVGWGTTSHLSEFDQHGKLVSELAVGAGRESYRGWRLKWSGTPRHSPAITASPHASTGQQTIHVSWNGATEVAQWELLLGSSPNHLQSAGLVAKRGFETAIRAGSHGGYAAVRARDSTGRILGRSRAVKL
jgi:hypothetical protein